MLEERERRGAKWRVRGLGLRDWEVSEGEGVYAGEEELVVVYGEGVRLGNLGLDY
jgi:hypothetical protein